MIIPIEVGGTIAKRCAGGIDAVDGIDPFKTWRTTAAYRLEETGTKFRATAGAGARVGSLFERYSQYGTPTLLPEKSVGYDVGLDQKFMDGRITTSISFFDNRYKDLIGFGATSSCTTFQMATVGGCYYNTGRAQTRGVEVSAEAVVVPDVLRVTGSYTHMSAKDLDSERSLYLRARDKGSASVIFTGIPKLELEARVTAAGYVPTYDYTNSQRVALAPYARVDLYGNYKIDDHMSVFARIENIGNTRYEQTWNYGTPGRSAYGGMKFTW